LTSFTGKGTYIGFETEQTLVPLEIFAKAPNQRSTIVHMAVGDKVTLYDGKAAWIAGSDKPVPLMALSGGNLEGAKIDALVAFPMQIKSAFSQWQLSATAIDDKEVYVLRGTNPRQAPVNFYFDQTSGLLVRVVRFVDTAVGRVPTQIDYADYRDVSGVKIPFKWTVTWTNGQTTSQMTQMQGNVTIDAARFARPAPARPPK
jgi:hypothetical protein